MVRSGELLGSGELVGMIDRRASKFGGLTCVNRVGIEIADVDTTDERLDDTPNEKRRSGGLNSPSKSSRSSSSNSDCVCVRVGEKTTNN